MSEKAFRSDSNHPDPRRRFWIRLGLVGLVVAAAMVATLFLVQETGVPTAAPEDDALHFAEVVIADLIQQETFHGILGSIEDDPVMTQRGGTITAIAAAGDTIGQGEALFAIDDQPVVLLYGDLPAFRDLAIGEEVVTISSPLHGTLTWVAEPGAVVEQGDVLYRVDGRPVVVLYGDQPAYRGLGLAGPNLDVVAARAALASARANLTALTAPPSDYQLLAAQENLAGAQQALQALLDLPDPDVVQIARSNLTAAEMTLRAAQSAYDQVAHLPDVGMSWEAMNLWQATNSYEQAQAEYNEALEGASVSDIAAARASVALAQAALDSLQAGPDADALAAAEAQVELAQLAVDAVLAEATPAGPLTGYDVDQLQAALVALGYDPEARLAAEKGFDAATQEVVEAWQADVGAEVDGVVDLGEVLFLTGLAQVLEILAPPGSPAGSVLSLAGGEPASGSDVRQIEEALLTLGFDAGGRLVADGVSTPETIEAVLAFQAATGLEPDGIVDLGEVVFAPAAVRITQPLATKGSAIGAGAPVLAVSLSEKVVRINLPADEQGLLAVGDAVTVEMPDRTEVAATVVFVSQTANPAANEWDPATFEVRIELDDPAVAGGLDEAPVDVIVVSDSVQDVMAIPVSALVALLEGGYAVEVDAGGGQTRLVAVEVGFFGSNNMIEITSGALEPGDRVVVP